MVASPAVSGPPGSRVVFAADVAGRMFALDAQNGAELWHYQAGGLIFASTAVANGNVYFGSQDGFVYDFAIGASTGSRPHATIDSPTDKATLPPSGNVTISGTASDDLGVTKVLISVRQDSGALWWDAAASKWQKFFVANPATNVQPRRQADRLDVLGARSRTTAATTPSTPTRRTPRVSTSLPSSPRPSRSATAPGAPDTVISAPTQKQVFNLPNPPASIPLTITGSATDTTGARPGAGVGEGRRREPGAHRVLVRLPGLWEPRRAERQPVDDGVHRGDGPHQQPGHAERHVQRRTVPSYDHEHSYRVSTRGPSTTTEIPTRSRPASTRSASAWETGDTPAISRRKRQPELRRPRHLWRVAVTLPRAVPVDAAAPPRTRCVRLVHCRAHRNGARRIAERSA